MPCECSIRFGVEIKWDVVEQIEELGKAGFTPDRRTVCSTVY